MRGLLRPRLNTLDVEEEEIQEKFSQARGLNDMKRAREDRGGCED
jgi:hypothetical protein